MEVKQLVQQIILDIADEIVEVAKEESSGREGNSGVVRRLILPLLQSQSIPPVSTLFPSPASHILQPKVLKQKKNDSCGYYALYNVITIAAALTAPSDALALSLLHSLRHRTRFWLFYTRVAAHLYKRSSATQKYPWTHEYIDKGVLERPYISYLMDSGLLQGNIDITILSDFSMTGMKHNILPLADLKKLSQVFANYKSDQVDRKEVEKCEAKGGNEEQIRNEKLEKESKQDLDTQGIFGGKDSRVHAFLVGQACHWISIVCVKFEGKVEVLVLDSRNHNLLTSTYEEFLRICDKNKEKVPDWQRHIYMCSLTEPKMTVDLFHDCVTGVRDVITSLLEHSMEGFLSSFEEHVEQSEMKDVWIVPFMTWLEMYWPPPIVESNIIRVLQTLGVSKLSPATRSKFMRMAKTIRERVGDFSECDIPVVQRFEVILQWLEKEILL